MRFFTLTICSIAVLAFASQSVSALPVNTVKELGEFRSELRPLSKRFVDLGADGRRIMALTDANNGAENTDPTAGTPAGTPTGNTAGTPTGNTAGTPTGNTVGNTAGNTAGTPTGNTVGNTAGNTADTPAGNNTSNAAIGDADFDSIIYADAKGDY